MWSIRIAKEHRMYDVVRSRPFQSPHYIVRLILTVAAAEARTTHDVSWAMASASVGPCVDEVIASALAISRKKSNQVGKHQMSEDGITDRR